MQFDAIIFDLDGTLLDTLEDIADAMNQALEAGGFPKHPLESYRHFVGDGVRMLATRTLPEGSRDDDTITRFTAQMREAYARNWDNKTAPYPGIPELLDALVERGITMAVLSNKPDDFTKLCVEKLLPGWQFAAVLGHREGLALKPDPAGAVEVAARLTVPRERILYVGDSGMDMQTAVRAGMVPLGVLWGFRSRDELLAAGAVSLAGTPSHVLSYLDVPR
jgi:phosphoglycolate phosphatase